MSTFEESPQVIEMEKFVLGAMLLKDGLIIPNVAAIVDSSDFYRPEHRIIFDAIMNLYKNKVTPNILTLVEKLREIKDKDDDISALKKIGIEYVLGITEVAHTTAYAEEYAEIIKEKSDLRRLIRTGNELVQKATEGIEPPLDIIADFQRSLNGFNNQKESFANVADYLKGKFTTDVHNNLFHVDRKSGFYNLDNFQHWKPGLYIIGATPACGKTTFCWQLLEQFALNGEHCIFCSYEMSKLELAAKTLARRLFIDAPRATLTAADILNGGYTSGLLQAAFFDVPLNFDVRKFSDETVDKLLAILRPIVADSDKPPIVCIDYLQRLIPRDHKSADTRSLVDDSLFKLKDFSQETNTTFIAISTFNRTNYNVPPSFENFKESGGIEYTADCVLAMQLNIANKLSGEKEGEHRLKINAAMKDQPREINLKCLKNRYGNNYDCYFQYYSAHDYFKPCEEVDFILSKSAPADEDDTKD